MIMTANAVMDSAADATTNCQKNWRVVEHRPRIKLWFGFDPSNVVLVWVSDQIELRSIGGRDLREILADQPVLNANDMNWILEPENQHLIPEDWRGNNVFFWGTVYADEDNNQYVGYIFWCDGSWNRGYRRLADGWRSYHPAALLRTLRLGRTIQHPLNDSITILCTKRIV